MSSYEYKVVPAPAKGKRGRGVQGPEGRFAHSLELLMNKMAAEGWEYQRAETLPSEEKSGLVSAQTVFRNVLIFRRPRSADLSAYDPRAIGAQGGRPLLLTTTTAATGGLDANGGLSGLLKRRAERSQGEETPEDTSPEEIDDLASRFSDDDGDEIEDGDAPAPQSRPTAAE